MGAQQLLPGNAAFFRRHQQCHLGGVACGRPAALVSSGAPVTPGGLLWTVYLGSAAECAADEQFLQRRFRQWIDVPAVLLDGAGFLQPRPGDGKRLAACPDCGDGHAVFGDGPRLVGADDAGTAQGLHAVQPVHQGVALHHPAHRQRQCNGDRRRESLRNGGDGNGDAGHEHIKDRFAPEYPSQKDSAAHPQTE